MPELPEVETVVRTLAPHVTGKRILGVPHLRADMVEPAGFKFARALENRTIRSVVRRAKRIVFTLDSGHRFYIHLGMTGRLSLEDPKSARRSHTHFVALLDNRRELRFEDPRRFGAIVWMGDKDHVDLGPEPFGLSADDFAARLKKTKRSIKAALLDQKVIAGIGNIYADEALFAAGIRPSTRADRLKRPRVESLLKSIQDVLNLAIDRGGSSIRDYVDANGSRGSFQASHKVYDRGGEPCLVCGTILTSTKLAGRTTCYCVKCQPTEQSKNRTR